LEKKGEKEGKGAGQRSRYIRGERFELTDFIPAYSRSEFSIPPVLNKKKREKRGGKKKEKGRGRKERGKLRVD